MKYTESLCNARRHAKTNGNLIKSKLDCLDSLGQLDDENQINLDTDLNCELKGETTNCIDSSAKTTNCKSNPLQALLNNLCYQVANCDEKHAATTATKNDLIIIK